MGRPQSTSSLVDLLTLGSQERVPPTSTNKWKPKEQPNRRQHLGRSSRSWR